MNDKSTSSWLEYMNDKLNFEIKKYLLQKPVKNFVALKLLCDLQNMCMPDEL